MLQNFATLTKYSPWIRPVSFSGAFYIKFLSINVTFLDEGSNSSRHLVRSQRQLFSADVAQMLLFTETALDGACKNLIWPFSFTLISFQSWISMPTDQLQDSIVLYNLRIGLSVDSRYLSSLQSNMDLFFAKV